MRTSLLTMLLAPLVLGVLAPTPARADDARIPLVPGLVLTYAQQTRSFDEEFLITIASADAQEIEYRVIAQRVLKGGARQANSWTRRVRKQDLVSTHRFNAVLQEGDPALFAGSSFLQMSAAVLAELKTQGRSEVIVASVPHYGEDNALLSIVAAGRKYYRGPLVRAATPTAPITVRVNGTPVALPAIQAHGRYSVGGDVEEIDGWWLDDADHALSLRTLSGPRNTQLVRIDYPDAEPEHNSLEHSLSDGDCRAVLHGIYFNTGSAELLAQSDAALNEIGAVLNANPDWTVGVEGHTDNIGGDAYNLDLSKRRAITVRDALSARFDIQTARLPAQGFGASRPVDTNDTLEGRAANRRVELHRQCP
jgi:outer membrane protein OmpA-like peptidoglycan-associated protein